MLPKEVIRLIKKTVAETLRKLEAGKGKASKATRGPEKGKRPGRQAESRKRPT